MARCAEVLQQRLLSVLAVNDQYLVVRTILTAVVKTNKDL